MKRSLICFMFFCSLFMSKATVFAEGYYDAPVKVKKFAGFSPITDEYEKEEKMENIIDYAEDQLATFKKRKFNQVDSLILAQLSYLKFENVSFKEKESVRLADLLKTEMIPLLLKDVRDPESNYQLLLAVGMSPRFRDIKLTKCKNQIDIGEEKQFSAVTFILPDQSLYIAYRGTDATLVGWKEDINMAFISPVPSQLEGKRYLEEIAQLYPQSEISLGGHSKGGNIAVYAASFCTRKTQNRIKRIYSHDGPGFTEEVLDSEKFKRISKKIKKTLPRQSIIGMLLQNQERYKVVDSNRFWVMQHDPFSWEVLDGDFVYCENVSLNSVMINKSINGWLASLSVQQREEFFDILFDLLNETGATNFKELTTSGYKQLPEVMNKFNNIEPETRKFVKKTISSLIAISFRNFHAVRRK